MVSAIDLRDRAKITWRIDWPESDLTNAQFPILNSHPKGTMAARGAPCALTRGNILMAVDVNVADRPFKVRAVHSFLEIRPRTGVRYAYAVSADGQRFLVNTLIEQASPAPITLPVNWPALLKKYA